MAASRVPDVVAAAVTALQDDATLTTLVGSGHVQTHIPQGTDPPYVWVMGGDELPWALTFAQFTDTTVSDGGDNGARTVDVRATCVSTYRGSKQVEDMASRVLEVLTTDATWATVTGFQVADFVRNVALQPENVNGVLWFYREVTVRVVLG
jgi:hypothetical protein